MSADAVAQGYVEFSYGASAELRPARFKPQSSASKPEKGHSVEPCQAEVQSTPLYYSLEDVVNSYKWVYALAGRVVHVHTQDGPICPRLHLRPLSPLVEGLVWCGWATKLWDWLIDPAHGMA